MSSFSELSGSVAKLEGALAAMRVSEKAAREVGDLLNLIVPFVTERERLLVDMKPSEKMFAPYHACRNLRLIFSKMRSRLAETPVAEDNNLVADHAREVVRKVLPLLSTLASIEAVPSDRDRTRVLEEVWRLRAVARRVNMTPSIAEELEGVDRKELVRVLDAMLMPETKHGQA